MANYINYSINFEAFKKIRDRYWLFFLNYYSSNAKFKLKIIPAKPEESLVYHLA